MNRHKTGMPFSRGFALTEYMVIGLLLMVVFISALKPLTNASTSQVAHLSSALAGETTQEFNPRSLAHLNIEAGTSGNQISESLADTTIQEAKAFVTGFIQGMQSQLESIADLFLHPIETLKSIKSLAQSLIDDPVQTFTAIRDALVKDLNQLVHGTHFEQGEVLGENMSPQAGMAAIAKISKAMLIAKRSTDPRPPVSKDVDVPASLLNEHPLYVNLTPDELAIDLSEAKKIGVAPIRPTDSSFKSVINQGTIKWVVDEAGELWLIQKNIGEVEIKHTVLSRGKNVYAAGEAEITTVGEVITPIVLNNRSGHYRPPEETLEIGHAAFKKYGLEFKQIEVERASPEYN